jgi:transcriptional regulator with XRE-family HTH domain
MKHNQPVEWNAELAPIVAAERETFEWELESIKLDIALAFEAERQFRDLSYKELAERIQTSPAYVTKVFRGESNLTIESMLKFARALKTKLNFSLDREDIGVQNHVCGIYPRVAANSLPVAIHRAPAVLGVSEPVSDSAWWTENVLNKKAVNF